MRAPPPSRKRPAGGWRARRRCDLAARPEPAQRLARLTALLEVPQAFGDRLPRSIRASAPLQIEFPRRSAFPAP